MKYSKFVIYMIRHKNRDIRELYIGSSTNFARRRSSHKKNVTNRVGKLYQTKLYKFIRHFGGWDNFTMEIVETYPCDNDMEAKAKEQYYIDLYKPQLNSCNSYNLNI